MVSPHDGLLAIDDNANGIIDNRSELFGSSTQDGFAVLEKLDTNGDGKINSSDGEFGRLRVWTDLDQNGISEVEELRTLSEMGITSISLTRADVTGSNAGHEIGFEAAFVRSDGTSAVAQTIYFQTDPRHSADNTPPFSPADGINLLPRLPGSGTISSIGFKLTFDAAFRSGWTALTDAASTMSSADLEAAFENQLLKWAGVDTVELGSRGHFVNASHLAFVEAFFGETYREVSRGEELRTFPSTRELGAAVEAAFEQIVSSLEIVFLAQLSFSTIMRGQTSLEDAFKSPYLFFGMLELGGVTNPTVPAATPGNVAAVLDLTLGNRPSEAGACTEYLTKALVALDGMVGIAFNGDRAAYANILLPQLSAITDETIRVIAAHIVDGTAHVGGILAEGINGTSSSDVFIAGGGGDVVSGGAGSDIYVYAKHDGDLWIKDNGEAPADSDKLVFTDLNASNVTIDRIGNDLLIRVTETGKTIAVTGFFAGQGIEVLRFADGTEWSRTQIKDASVFRGDGHNNTIFDSASDDVIYGSQGDDYIRIGAGNDKILYGKGDGYDIVNDSSTSPAEHDTLVLTDINASDIQLSRVGGHLILTVKSTGEYVDFDDFFPVDTGDWNTTARSIDKIRFANGKSWSRQQIQQNAWYRGTDPPTTSTPPT